MFERPINRVTRIPALGPGFAGEYHRAALVVEPDNLPATDPFFLMADDNITLAGPLGDAHPHAGLETVTFMLNGTLEDINGRLDEGDVEWMTAGSGIVHGEDTKASTGMRLFQLWLVLPEAQRNMPPRVQVLRRAETPVHSEPGVIAKVYSGQLESAAAPTLNEVPVTLADIRLTPGTVFTPQLPAAYNAFLVVIDGDIEAGRSAESLAANMVGWSEPSADGVSLLALRAGLHGARLLLYAGQPQDIQVVDRAGKVTGRDNGWTQSRVCTLRNYHQIDVYREGERQERGELTLDEAAEILALSPSSVRRLIQEGKLPAGQFCKGAPWIIKIEDLGRQDVIEAADQRRGPRPPSENPDQKTLAL